MSHIVPFKTSSQHCRIHFELKIVTLHQLKWALVIIKSQSARIFNEITSSVRQNFQVRVSPIGCHPNFSWITTGNTENRGLHTMYDVFVRRIICWWVCSKTSVVWSSGMWHKIQFGITDYWHTLRPFNKHIGHHFSLPSRSAVHIYILIIYFNNKCFK